MNLHGDIMNLPCDYESACGDYELTYDAYKYGHRDARHAAAELAIKADSLLEDYDAVIRKICFEYSAGGYNSDGLMAPKTVDDKLRWIIDDVQRSNKYAAAESLKKADNKIEDLEAKLLDADYQARRKVACAMGLTEEGFNDGKRISYSWEYLLRIVAALAYAAGKESN